MSGDSKSNVIITPGCMVRARRRSNRSARVDDGGQVESPSIPPSFFSCRATVATVSESVVPLATVIWEDMAPRPLPAPVGGDVTRKRLNRSFLVAPLLHARTSADNDQEEELPLSSLEALLPFEHDDGRGRQLSSSPSPVSLKEQGDALLRLKDYSAAIARYEAALAATSSLDLGGTVIINDGTGRAVLAEVDCIDEENNKRTADDTIVGSGEEKTVDAKDILLCLLENDKEERLQERMLLNLSRCLLQLASADGSADAIRATKYRKAAVLGCTLALSCASYAGEGSDNVGVDTETKARLIRAGAYLDLGKAKHATADVKHVLKTDVNNAQAKKLVRDIERRDIQRKRTDKRLAKDVCRWVNAATDVATNGGGAPVSDDGSNGSSSPPHVSSSATNSSLCNNLLFQILFVLLVSIAVKLWMQAYDMLKQY